MSKAGKSVVVMGSVCARPDCCDPFVAVYVVSLRIRVLSTTRPLPTNNLDDTARIFWRDCA